MDGVRFREAACAQLARRQAQGTKPNAINRLAAAPAEFGVCRRRECAPRIGAGPLFGLRAHAGRAHMQVDRNGAGPRGAGRLGVRRQAERQRQTKDYLFHPIPLRCSQAIARQEASLGARSPCAARTDSLGRVVNHVEKHVAQDHSRREYFCSA
jgi:hypothetical protein